MYYEYPFHNPTCDHVGPGEDITIIEDLYTWWAQVCGFVNGREDCTEATKSSHTKSDFSSSFRLSSFFAMKVSLAATTIVLALLL